MKNTAPTMKDVAREAGVALGTVSKVMNGIFCGTDRMAMCLWKLLARMGIRVPEEVQLIGFDGLRRMSDQEYHCSTIVQPVDQIARTCVNILLSEDRSSLPATICLPVSYGAGGSTRE